MDCMEILDSFAESSPFHKQVPPVEDVRRILKRYDIGELVAVHGGLGGCLNVNLKVQTTGGMYVVRVLSGFAIEEHIEFTLQVIGFLRDEGIPALDPLKTPDGCPFVGWNDRLIMLTPFIAGRPFMSRVRQARASGEMLRRMHDALVDVEDGPRPGWSNYPSEEIMDEGLSRLAGMRLPSQQVQEARRLHELVMTRWRTVSRDLPMTIIHGDWHPGNQIFTDGRVTCILDFDFIQRAERLHDLGYALWSLLPGNSSRSLSRSSWRVTDRSMRSSTKRFRLRSHGRRSSSSARRRSPRTRMRSWRANSAGRARSSSGCCHLWETASFIVCSPWSRSSSLHKPPPRRNTPQIIEHEANDGSGDDLMFHRMVILLAMIGTLACTASGGEFKGEYCSGKGDTEFLRLIDESFGYFHPNPNTPNISMLYYPEWDCLIEGFPSWMAWWIQNSYGPTYCSLPFLQEPWLELPSAFPGHVVQQPGRREEGRLRAVRRAYRAGWMPV